ncbi:amidase [Shimia abyssi]|uniref:Amidase n=1 Tax=Shimia abyssi TaxID=1662395 RepID=A0A2P8FJD5_9RHOB|nr:amidase [Shimia abyssi]PSL21818.1 amidase [Shimia abyssi]
MSFLDWDAGALLAALRSGELSAETVMAATLERVKARNAAVNAIVDLREADVLMSEARAADQGTIRGKLHGLPMAIKGLAHVQGTRNTEGSPLYVDRISEVDSRFVSLLRNEGAIFIGKTNVPEFGLGSHSYNPVHGVTRNPYAEGRTAGGSSGGAGAALAMGMVALADGSDAMGSLRNPAGWNNVYGFRPSFGVVPREPGDEVFWQQLSTLGPMARSPRDIALMMDVMAEPNPAVPFNTPRQPWALGEAPTVSGVRVGWLGDWGGAMPMEQGILDLCKGGLSVLSNLGAEVAPMAAPFDAEEMFASWRDLRAFALAGDMAGLFENPETRARLKPEAQWEIACGQELSVAQLHAACATRSAWFRRAAAVFEDVEVLALPVSQCWPFPIDWDWPKEISGRAMDTYHRWMQVMVPVSLIGLPAISVPVGFSDQGLPMGMQLFARKGADVALLQVAEAYHQATGWPQSHPPIA